LSETAVALTYLPLNRYSLREGKIYGIPKSSVKCKINRISHDTVYYKNLKTNKYESAEIRDLIKRWNAAGFKEITDLDSVIEFLRNNLNPILGAALVAVIIKWIKEKV
jgi:predicted metal-dependent RNase